MGLSLKHLEDAGLLLPRDEWEKEDPHSYTSRTAVMFAWLIAAVSAVLMYVGDGHTLTWVGLMGMLIFLAWFTFISLRAIAMRDAAATNAAAEADDE